MSENNNKKLVEFQSEKFVRFSHKIVKFSENYIPKITVVLLRKTQVFTAFSLRVFFHF